MTNFKTIAGAATWGVVYGILLFAALEPVEIAPAPVQVAAIAASPAAAA